MKKKIFTLLTLALAVCSGAWADDTYTVSFGSSDWTQSTANYFTSAGTKNNPNANYAGKYNGTSYDKGLKMESDTKVQFTTTRTFDITIVRSTKKNSDKTIKFGLTGSESALTFGDVLSDDNNEYVAIATLTNLAAGTYQIVRGSGEAGIVYVSVTEKGSALTKLATPNISVNSASGEVSISSVTNASKVTYTTDGKAPTAESTEYTTAFTVEDGTTIKAIAIGDGSSYSNSDVASQQVLLTGITISDPVVKQSYGTVAITCENPNATIEYSLDGGTTWNTYTRAFTLTTDTELKARASRTGCTASDVVDASINAVAANSKTTKTLVFGYGAFEGSGKVLTGKTSDIANGYTLTMLTDQDKSWGSREKITISSINAERTTFCGSNGVQCRLDLPDGIKVTRLTLYSYVNSATSTTNCAWKEVNGENLNSVLNDVPMGAFTDLSDYKTNPDIRIFPLDEVEGSITFTNGGLQTCFVMELDIIEAPVAITPANAKSTYVTTNKLDFTNVDGLKAYVATSASASGVKMETVGAVPAGTPLMLVGTAGTEYTVPVAASATAPETNLLRAGDGTTVFDGTTYDYILFSDGLFYQIGEGTVATTKAYLHLESAPSSARALAVIFGDETTGISSMHNSQCIMHNEIYNLSGQRVSQPTKGLYIVNGKKVIMK